MHRGFWFCTLLDIVFWDAFALGVFSMHGHMLSICTSYVRCRSHGACMVCCGKVASVVHIAIKVAIATRKYMVYYQSDGLMVRHHLLICFKNVLFLLLFLLLFLFFLFPTVPCFFCSKKFSVPLFWPCCSLFPVPLFPVPFASKKFSVPCSG